MISFGERFAILMPSIFFWVVSLITSLEARKESIEIGAILSTQEDSRDFFPEIVREMLSSSYHSVFLEFIILSITNGLSIIFVLHESVIGTIFSIFGIIVSLFGFSYLGIEKQLQDNHYEKDERSNHGYNEVMLARTLFIYSGKIDTITAALSIGQIGYIGSYGCQFTKNIPIEWTPWFFFTVCLIIGLFFSQYLIERILFLNTSVTIHSWT